MLGELQVKHPALQYKNLQAVGSSGGVVRAAFRCHANARLRDVHARQEHNAKRVKAEQSKALSPTADRDAIPFTTKLAKDREEKGGHGAGPRPTAVSAQCYAAAFITGPSAPGSAKPQMTSAVEKGAFTLTVYHCHTCGRDPLDIAHRKLTDFIPEAGAIIDNEKIPIPEAIKLIDVLRADMEEKMGTHVPSISEKAIHERRQRLSAATGTVKYVDLVDSFRILSAFETHKDAAKELIQSIKHTGYEQTYDLPNGSVTLEKDDYMFVLTERSKLLVNLAQCKVLYADHVHNVVASHPDTVLLIIGGIDKYGIIHRSVMALVSSKNQRLTTAVFAEVRRLLILVCKEHKLPPVDFDDFQSDHAPALYVSAVLVFPGIDTKRCVWHGVARLDTVSKKVPSSGTKAVYIAEELDKGALSTSKAATEQRSLIVSHVATFMTTIDKDLCYLLLFSFVNTYFSSNKALADHFLSHHWNDYHTVCVALRGAARATNAAAEIAARGIRAWGRIRSLFGGVVVCMHELVEYQIRNAKSVKAQASSARIRIASAAASVADYDQDTEGFASMLVAEAPSQDLSALPSAPSPVAPSDRRKKAPATHPYDKSLSTAVSPVAAFSSLPVTGVSTPDAAFLLLPAAKLLSAVRRAGIHAQIITALQTKSYTDDFAGLYNLSKLGWKPEMGAEMLAELDASLKDDVPTWNTAMSVAVKASVPAPPPLPASPSSSSSSPSAPPSSYSSSSSSSSSAPASSPDSWSSGAGSSASSTAASLAAMTRKYAADAQKRFSGFPEVNDPNFRELAKLRMLLPPVEQHVGQGGSHPSGFLSDVMTPKEATLTEDQKGRLKVLLKNELVRAAMGPGSATVSAESFRHHVRRTVKSGRQPSKSITPGKKIAVAVAVMSGFVAASSSPPVSAAAGAGVSGSVGGTVTSLPLVQPQHDMAAVGATVFKIDEHVKAGGNLDSWDAGELTIYLEYNGYGKGGTAGMSLIDVRARVQHISTAKETARRASQANVGSSHLPASVSSSAASVVSVTGR